MDRWQCETIHISQNFSQYRKMIVIISCANWLHGKGFRLLTKGYHEFWGYQLIAEVVHYFHAIMASRKTHTST